MYPFSWEGLVHCYTAAIPFYRQTLLSTFMYSAVFFGIYELSALFVRKSRHADWLLAA